MLSTHRRRALALLIVLAAIALTACSSGADATPTVQSTTVPAPTSAPAPTTVPEPTTTSVAPTAKPDPTATLVSPTAKPDPTATTPSQPQFEPVVFDAAALTIAVDGDSADWDSVTPQTVTLQQSGPIEGHEWGAVDPIDVSLRVAADSDNVYILMEVPGDFLYNAEDHSFSPALAVMTKIEAAAGPAMGSDEIDIENALGLVDIWHWELDCAPGAISGGTGVQANGVTGGNDPACNFDDEYSTSPDEREDDGSSAAENTLTGVWDHTARSIGPGANGTWIFEMSRPLLNDDPQDGQFVLGQTNSLALAFWAPDETDKGWNDAGHLQSASKHGWIEVTLPSAAEAAVASTSGVSITASAATIAVDGDTSDWKNVAGAQVRLQQIAPIPGVDMGELAPIDATLRVATDSDNIYVLLEVPDDYDYNPANSEQSGAAGVMFLIDPAAAPHMGAEQEDQDTSLGKVDIWHFEPECGPGALTGGGAIMAGGVTGGNDPACNLDDEYSTTPSEREDDGSVAAENSLVGVWTHTAKDSGNGAEGTWIYEMSRPLNTGDSDDAQFVPGSTAKMALAYWDADENADGWTDPGHVQSSDAGWIEVTLPSAAEAAATSPADVSITASAATIAVDGDTSDWKNIAGAQVRLQQILPIPGVDMGELAPIDVTLRVAADADNIYVLMEVPDDYDYVPGSAGISAATAVMFLIDPEAGAHMGTEQDEQDVSLGKVDIWHWELDCGPGVISGGVGIQASGVTGGNDPSCNLDDEYSTTPTDREDDGSVDAENSITGVWTHTAKDSGIGAEGTWIFEYSRPLNTGDPDDAQFVLGSTARIALAYWDADETADGWTGPGHLQSSDHEWMEVTLPSAAEAAATSPADVSITASTAAIVVDGDTSDWKDVAGAQVRLQQILPIPGVDMGELAPIDVTLRVATDADNIYVLMEVPDDYDYVPGSAGISAATAVMFLIDPEAGAHMGTEQDEQDVSLGKVDIWHWELDCGPGVLSGGVAIDASGVTGGNDPSCNLDDEYSTTPTDREDDGSVDAENSISGVWTHTAKDSGLGAEGTWIFEYSRPLITGDPDDAQFVSGSTARIALAYWDADETVDGWTGPGHLQSSDHEWMEVVLP